MMSRVDLPPDFDALQSSLMMLIAQFAFVMIAADTCVVDKFWCFFGSFGLVLSVHVSHLPWPNNTSLFHHVFFALSQLSH